MVAGGSCELGLPHQGMALLSLSLSLSSHHIFRSSDYSCPFSFSQDASEMPWHRAVYCQDYNLGLYLVYFYILESRGFLGCAALASIALLRLSGITMVSAARGFSLSRRELRRRVFDMVVSETPVSFSCLSKRFPVYLNDFLSLSGPLYPLPACYIP